MKICPQCQTSYPDDSLQFCLQDGSPLVLLASRQSQIPTQSFRKEEIVTMIDDAPTLQQRMVTQTFPDAPVQNQSNSKIVAILSGIIGILLLGLIGIGAWAFLRDVNKTETSQNPNGSPSPQATNSPEIGNSNIKSPTPAPSPSSSPDIFKKTPNSNTAFNSTPMPTPKQELDSEQIRTEVSGKVYNWKSGLESGSLNAVMSNYADRMDYYFNKGGVGIDAVRADKQRAFRLFNSFQVNLSNLRITPDETGEKATAVFDKEWFFTGTKNNSGKVQSQLQLTKLNGQWRITGEKDLKVYYVNK